MEKTCYSDNDSKDNLEILIELQLPYLHAHRPNTPPSSPCPFLSHHLAKQDNSWLLRKVIVEGGLRVWIFRQEYQEVHRNIFDIYKEYSYGSHNSWDRNPYFTSTIVFPPSSICQSRAWSKEGVCSDNPHLVKSAASIAFRLVNKQQGKKKGKKNQHFFWPESNSTCFFLDLK